MRSLIKISWIAYYQRMFVFIRPSEYNFFLYFTKKNSTLLLQGHKKIISVSWAVKNVQTLFFTIHNDLITASGNDDVQPLTPKPPIPKLNSISPVVTGINPNLENYKICIFLYFSITKCWIPEGDKGGQGLKCRVWERVERWRGWTKNETRRERWGLK